MRILHFFGLVTLCYAKLDFADTEKVSKHLHESSKVKTADLSAQNLEEDCKRAFISKRKDHQTAVSNFFSIEEAKRTKFIEDVVRNVQTLLDSSREVLQRIGHKPEDPFPQNGELIQNALSTVLENMALFTDIYTNFSTLVSKLFQKNRKLNNVIDWGYHYSMQTGLVDAGTRELMNNMASLLNFGKNSEKKDQYAIPESSISKGGKMNQEKASSIKKDKSTTPKTEL